MTSGRAHVDVSFIKPRSCPNKCGQIVLNREFESHVNNICPLRQTLCLDGCGQIVLGKDIRLHAKTCIMVKLCERGDLALRERALRELKLVAAELYSERERAAARHESHGGELSRKGWATSKLASHVARIESGMKDLFLRCRRKSKDNLTLALATASSEGTAGAGAGPPSAFKQLDQLGSILKPRGARPWDLEAPGLDGLLDALEEASVCGGNDKLRMDCEGAVLALLERLLLTALLTNDAEVLEQTSSDVVESLKLIELSGLGKIPALLSECKNALHCAALAAVPREETSPEFFGALKNGDMEMILWLFDREQVNPSSVDPRSGFPAIMIAARAGDLEMCQLLISRRADVNARCEIDGFSALHWAAHTRYARVVQALLDGGANPRLKDKRGHDPLMKLVRRDLNAPAAGCAWTWDMQPCRRLPGPELPGSGVMDFDDAKVAAEAIPDCVGISFRSVGASSTAPGRCYFSLRGPASMARSAKRRKKPELDATEEALAGSETEAVKKIEGEEAEQGEEEEEDESEEEEEEEEDEALWTTYLRVATNPAHDVVAMLAGGADASAQDFDGLSVLHHHLLSAPKRGSYDVVAALLRAQADVNAMDTTARSTTPFLLVVGARRADLLRSMLKDS